MMTGGSDEKSDAQTHPLLLWRVLTCDGAGIPRRPRCRSPLSAAVNRSLLSTLARRHRRQRHRDAETWYARRGRDDELWSGMLDGLVTEDLRRTGRIRGELTPREVAAIRQSCSSTSSSNNSVTTTQETWGFYPLDQPSPPSTTGYFSGKWSRAPVLHHRDRQSSALDPALYRTGVQRGHRDQRRARARSTYLQRSWRMHVADRARKTHGAAKSGPAHRGARCQTARGRLTSATYRGHGRRGEEREATRRSRQGCGSRGSPIDAAVKRSAREGATPAVAAWNSTTAASVRLPAVCCGSGCPPPRRRATTRGPAPGRRRASTCSGRGVDIM